MDEELDSLTDEEILEIYESAMRDGITEDDRLSLTCKAYSATWDGQYYCTSYG